MTPASILALVIVLNSAHATTEETVATMPAADCLATAQQFWQLPADTVAGAPTLDAYCVDPAKAGPVGVTIARPVS